MSLICGCETAHGEHILMTLDHIRLNISVNGTCVGTICHARGVDPTAYGKVAIGITVSQVCRTGRHSLLDLGHGLLVMLICHSTCSIGGPSPCA